MNDQWKEYVKVLRAMCAAAESGSWCAKALKLIEAQDAVVKAAINHCFALQREREVHAGEFSRDKVIEAEADALAFERELPHALHALAELKLE